MQSRMKQYPLDAVKIEELLTEEPVGRVASNGADGFPYVTPVHYVILNGKIYFHGLATGEKIQNIRASSLVCFQVDKMRSIIHDDTPCDTNTEYRSVIIRGTAEIVVDNEEKVEVLNAVVEKFTPQHTGKSFSENMLKMTAVVRISPVSCTGKYYTPMSKGASDSLVATGGGG